MQYAATTYVELLSGRDVAISMAAVGKPEGNGFAERLMRTIQKAEVDLSEYEDLADARRPLGRFLDDVYDPNRIHTSLRSLTPAEFQEQWMNTQRTQSSTVTEQRPFQHLDSGAHYRVVDQYQVEKIDGPGGDRVSDPNRLDDERYIVRLVGQVVRVSVETARIVESLPAEFAPAS